MKMSKKGAIPFIAVIVVIALLVGVVIFFGDSNSENIVGDAKSIGKSSKGLEKSPRSIKDRITGIYQADTTSEHRRDGYIEIAPEEDMWELVEDCLEGPPPYLFDSSGQQIPNNVANCEEWAENQVQSDRQGCNEACLLGFSACMQSGNDDSTCGSRQSDCFSRCESRYP
jgi:hypothetical protein